MQLNKTTNHAIQILVLLATNSDQNLTVSYLANKSGITRRYMQKIIKPLRQAGYLSVKAGPNGGYSLVCPPRKITLYDIVCLMEGKHGILPPTSKICNSETHNYYLDHIHKSLQQIVTEYLKSVSIQAIINENYNQFSQIDI